jgi:hypothetical protein
MMLMNSETKTASPGQSQQPSGPRHPGGEAAELVDPAGAGAARDDPDEDKQKR